MLTVVVCLDWSGKSRTLSPLSSWYSVIPSTVVTSRTPAGRAFALAVGCSGAASTPPGFNDRALTRRSALAAVERNFIIRVSLGRISTLKRAGRTKQNERSPPDKRRVDEQVRFVGSPHEQPLSIYQRSKAAHRM